MNESDIGKALKSLETVETFPKCDKKHFGTRFALPGFVDWDIFQAEQKRKTGRMVPIKENLIVFVEKCKSAE